MTAINKGDLRKRNPLRNRTAKDWCKAIKKLPNGWRHHITYMVLFDYSKDTRFADSAYLQRLKEEFRDDRTASRLLCSDDIYEGLKRVGYSDRAAGKRAYGAKWKPLPKSHVFEEEGLTRLSGADTVVGSSKIINKDGDHAEYEPRWQRSAKRGGGAS